MTATGKGMGRGYYPRPSAAERFRAKVNVDGPLLPGMESPCWLWTARLCAKGYGRFRLADGRSVYASRAAWILAHGDIPSEAFACHRCDNPACVRLDHLFLGTSQDNAADRHAKQRDAKGERHGSRRHIDHWTRGTDHHSARLTEAKVLEIRQKHAAGTQQIALAAEYGISQRSIAKVVHRISWKHVEDRSAA